MYGGWVLGQRFAGCAPGECSSTGDFLPCLSGRAIAHQHVTKSSSRENVVGIEYVLSSFEAAETGRRECQFELIAIELLTEGKNAL